MEQLVRVQKTYEDGTAQVLHERLSACSGDCHKCAGCGAVKQTMLLKARNPIGAKPGDLVVISSDSGPVLAGAAVLYLVPVLLFLAGYLAGQLCWQQGAFAGVLGFLLGIGIAVIYDRRIVKKRKTVYTITGYGNGSSHNQGKEDNNLD